MKNTLQITLKRVQSILLVAVPVFFASVLLCFFCIKAFESSIVKNTASIAQYSSRNVDNRLSEIVRTAKSLELSSENRSLKELQQSPDEITKQMYKLSVRMKECAGTNKLISCIYTYYPSINIVVCNFGAFEASAFFALHVERFRENETIWEDSLLQENLSGFYYLDYGKFDRFCYIDQLQKEGQINAITVIELNEKELENIIGTNTDSNSYSSYLLYKNNPLMFTDKDSTIIASISSKIKSMQANGQNIYKSDGLYMFLSTSAHSNLGYVTVYSSRGLMRSLYNVLGICIVLLCLSLLFIIVTSIWFGYKKNKSIVGLLERIGSPTGLSENDEYEYISKKIDQMISVGYKNEKRMEEYQERLNSLFLSSILGKCFTNESDIFMTARQYGINFCYSGYRVILIETQKGTFDLSEAENISHKLQSIGTDANTECLVTYDNGSYRVLLNSDNIDTEEQAVLTAKKLLDTAFENTEAHAGIGHCYDSSICISDSYTQAKKALDSTPADISHPVKLFVLCSEDSASNSYIDSAKSTQEPKKSVKTKKSTRAKKDISIAEHAKKLIDDDYSNPMLGLYMISQKLYVNNSYLSTSFKTTYNVSIIQYINSKRIEKAKELILTTNRSIKEIAQEVGYSSDINFIRVFKKYENDTPVTCCQGLFSTPIPPCPYSSLHCAAYA